MFLLKAGFEEVHFSHPLRINRTLFFETGISDRQKTVLNRKQSFVEEFGKTIVFLNQMFIRVRAEATPLQERRATVFLQQEQMTA
jgi:hypothetical protein